MTPAGLPPTMTAWVVTRYGGPQVLERRELPLPQPGPRDVLIRVAATTVSSGDRRVRAFDLPKGLGLPGRLMLGWRGPRRPVLGTEAVGEVVAVGARVTRFGPGDDVIAFPGAAFGAHAEYLRIGEDRAIVHRPAGMALEAAAALGFGGLTAIDYLRRADLRSGERVLVIGASGAVGSALVQLAVDRGALVTTLTSAGNRPLAASLGAGETLDSAMHDPATLGARFDVVADAVGTLTFRGALGLLAEGGRFLAVAGGLSDLLARRIGSRRPIAGPAAERAEDLRSLVALAGGGRFRPLVDSVFGFEAMPAAHARVDTGRKRGSVVVRLDRAPDAASALPPGRSIA